MVWLLQKIWVIAVSKSLKNSNEIKRFEDLLTQNGPVKFAHGQAAMYTTVLS